MEIQAYISQLLNGPVDYGMIDRSDLETILSSVYAVRDVSGDVVEFGCHRGQTSVLIQKEMMDLGIQKSYHVYDSFQGLPEPGPGDLGIYRFQAGACRCQEDDFKAMFSAWGVPLPTIHVGWFREIPESEHPQQISFAFIDGDLYESIWDDLTIVRPRMVAGGMIYIHDYGYDPLPGVKRAVDEFLGPVLTSGGMAYLTL